jgi:putative toxin-antitoxin system antitoxin component (TIGR02293 family)
MRRSTSAGRPQRNKPAGFTEEEQPFLHDEMVRGIDARRVKRLIERGVLSAKQVYRVIPERTFNRRLAKREALKPAEADAIGRLVRITDTAQKMLGDKEFAHEWLTLPNPALKWQVPIEMAESDAGVREVDDALSRFGHGDYI